MILTCPNCTTRYLVAAESIGAEGRQVRCASCSYTWYQDPQYPSAETEAASPPEPAFSSDPDLSKYDIPIESGVSAYSQSLAASNTKSPAESAPAPYGLKLAFWLLLVLALLTAGTVFHGSVIKYLPLTEPIYALSGMYSSKGVALTDIRVKKLQAKGAPRYTITCKIINLSDTARRLPALTVSLIDASGNVITSQRQRMSRDTPLKPQESIACDTLQIELVHASKNTKQVRLDIGSPYDVMLRD